MFAFVLPVLLGASAPLLVTPEQLHRAMSRAVIVDARDSSSYETGHIEGAISLPWVDLAHMPKSPSARTPREMAQILTSRGIPSAGWVVVYGAGGQGFGEEGRMFWSLWYLGQHNVSLLDGGLPAWTRAALPLTTEAAIRPATKFTDAADASL